MAILIKHRILLLIQHISFLVNCNLQHYSGESGLTYLTQLFVITFLQFVSAATGIACLIALFNGLKEKTTNNLGNFWNIFVKSQLQEFYCPYQL